MKKILLTIVALMTAAQVAQASARCEESVVELLKDLQSLGADISGIDTSKMVTAKMVAPVLDEVTEGFKVKALAMDAAVVKGEVTEEELSDFAAAQYNTLYFGFERHVEECGALLPEIKKVIRKSLAKAEAVAQMVEDKQITRYEAAVQLDRIAEAGSEEAIVAAENYQARLAAYKNCLETKQESQCKKKYGF